MISWLRDKLDQITGEFLGGGGYGTVFEAQFLAYLECYVAARGGDPTTVWSKLRQRQQEIPEGEEVRSFSHTITDRQELVDVLQTFRRQFEGPRKSNYSPTAARAQPESVARSREGMEAILDLLGGEDP